MTTKRTKPSKDQPVSPSPSGSASKMAAASMAPQTLPTQSVLTQTVSSSLPHKAMPVLIGFYYAVSNEATHDFTLLQVINTSPQHGLPVRIKLRQFAAAYKVLPDFLIPDQLGDAVANFWLPLDEWTSWQPLLMQRGVVREGLMS